jgi:glycosyltransferase involved in cell wall biosynthesis
MNVCMIGYAEYVRDARIKNYVRQIEQIRGVVDVLVLKEPGKPRSERHRAGRIRYLTRKYRGKSILLYLFSYAAFFIAAFAHLTYRSLRHRYDAVHVHNMPNLLVFAAVVAKLRGSRILLDVHDLMTATYMAKFNAPHTSIILKCLLFEQIISARFASHVLCADHLQKEYLETICNVPAAKISVIMNLPCPDVFRSVPPRRSAHQFTLVYHGTIARRLGIDIILHAVSKLERETPIHLTIFGTGDFLPAALALQQTLSLTDRVSFSKAYFPAELVPEMVGGMDLGIIGNRRSLATDRFMLPVKLLDYVRLGIPVIAPRLAIIQRYFDDDMIRFYEPEDVDDLARCIMELYHSPDQRRRLACNAARFFDTHSWATQADMYLSLLCDSAATASSSPDRA